MFQEAQDKRGEAIAWDVLQQVRFQEGDKAQAMRACKAARFLYQAVGDTCNEAHMLQLTSTLHEAKGNCNDAIRAAREALAIMRRAQDAKGEVAMLVLLAQAQTSALVKDRAAAAERAVPDRPRPRATQEEYYALLEAGYDPVTITRRFFGAGGSSGRAKVVTEDGAIESAQEAVALCRAEITDEKDFLGYAMYVLAQIHVVCKRYTEGLQDSNEALEIFKETENRYGEACAMLLGAQALHLDGKQEDAMSDAGKALDIFKEIEHAEGARRAEEMISEFTMAGQPLMAALTLGTTTPAGGSGTSVAVPTKNTMDPSVAMKMIKSIALETIGNEDDDLDLDSPLMDVGLDSLAAVDFRQRLQNESGLNMPASLVFDYPTARAMTDFVVESSG